MAEGVTPCADGEGMSPSPNRDVLAISVGAGGIRARRTGLDVDAPDSTVEIPRPVVDEVAPPAEQVVGLVAELGALTQRDGRPPEAVVAAVPEGWYEAAPGLLSGLRVAMPGARCAVVATAYAALVGAHGGVKPGICLDVGAEASVVATDSEGLWFRGDGWGPLLGSRGSGAWLGAQGLAAGLRWRDGVPDGSEALLVAGRAAFGPEEGWPALVAGRDAATALTTFAPAVCEVAREDPLARAIVEAAAEHLADTVQPVRDLLPGAPVAVVGGLLYLDAMRVAIASAFGKRRIVLVPALGGALEGARLVGEHLLSGGGLPHRPPFVVLDHRGELPT